MIQIFTPEKEKSVTRAPNGLANRWNRKRITKKAHADRGLKTLWEMSAKHSFILYLQPNWHV
jgi:hypothetical protein